jgi:hypothetical protein
MSKLGHLRKYRKKGKKRMTDTYTTEQAKARLGFEKNARRVTFYRLRLRYPKYFVTVERGGGKSKQTTYQAEGIDKLAAALDVLRKDTQ